MKRIMVALSAFIGATAVNVSGIQDAWIATVLFIVAGLMAEWGIITASKSDMSRRVKFLLVMLVIGSVSASIWLTFAARSARQHLNELAIRVQQIESVNKGLVQLGGADVETRLAGIDLLERIAFENSSERDTILQQFISYLHNRSPWPIQEWEHQPKECLNWVDPCIQDRSVRTPSDTQRVLNAIRNLREIDQRYSIKINETDLKKGNLEGADLRDAVFYFVNLRCSVVQAANLKDARISNSTLAWINANNIVFAGAIITDSDLTGAQFAGASLIETQFVGTSLVRAYFSGASLQRAIFNGTNVGCAVFDNADLTSADFSGANHLDCKQIKRAKTQDIKLPSYLNGCR